jgi:predicted transcriptional regulator
MNDEQTKILKVMIEAKGHLDLHMLAAEVNLNPNQTMAVVQELAEMGFLGKVGKGYGVTEKGKSFLKAYGPVESGMEFQFTLKAQNIAEFYHIIKQVNAELIEFHVYRGDFENWLKDAAKNQALATDFGAVKAEGLKGEALRAELLKLLNLKFHFEDTA